MRYYPALVHYKLNEEDQDFLNEGVTIMEAADQDETKDDIKIATAAWLLPSVFSSNRKLLMEDEATLDHSKVIKPLVTYSGNFVTCTSLKIICEGCNICSSDNHADALLALVASYFAFDIRYTTSGSLLDFLQIVILDIKQGIKIPRKLSSALKNLSALIWNLKLHTLLTLLFMLIPDVIEHLQAENYTRDVQDALLYSSYCGSTKDNGDCIISDENGCLSMSSYFPSLGKYHRGIHVGHMKDHHYVPLKKISPIREETSECTSQEYNLRVTATSSDSSDRYMCSGQFYYSRPVPQPLLQYHQPCHIVQTV
ncbi:hypothetical protein BSL78_24359 [Apostichopus japonicus]|uniref:Uncharacterized protein n=1 Tax=Stichopus japonicus TaxID=307972 RepID=A0A2G8JSR2_STIJA|nr:hypothetical protein BSL78_24359 [Apostichopus japonicus]